MPLNGRLLYDPFIESSSPSDENDKPFVIPYTKEVFYSETEYKERLELYERRIWICQCTGRHKLTYQEALESEKRCRERLAGSYGEVWEKPVLKLVQHSFAPLDVLIQQAHDMFLTKLMPGEKVTFTPKPNKTYAATIVESGKEPPSTNEESEEQESPDGKSTTNTSPSSDKENKGRQTLITDMFKSGNRRSPRAAVSSKTLPIKGKRPSLLPLQYAISLVDENKIVNGVPCEYLTRTEKPPNRELIRWFIRSNAIKPFGVKEIVRWIVDENMAFRYSLKSLITPEEEADMIQRSTFRTLAFLRELRDNDLREQRIKKTLDEVVDLSSSPMDDDQNQFASIFDKSHKRKRESLTLGGAKRPKHDKNKKKIAKSKHGLDSYLMKSPSSMASNEHGLENGIVMNGVSSDSEVVNGVLSPDHPVSHPFDRQSTSSRKNSSPRKKKQATLLELTKKGGIKLLASRTPAKQRGTPTKNTPRRTPQPIIVRQMLSLKKEKVFRSHKYKLMTSTACKILTKKQLQNLPAEVKDDIMRKWEHLEFKKKCSSMTPEERRKWMKEYRAKNGSQEAQDTGRYEDQHLVRVGRPKALPNFEPVSLPGELPTTLFGDIAMICEFLHSYHNLLSPKDAYYHKQFTLQSVGEAVANGKTGFAVTSKILIILLQTLLVDGIAKDYMELDYKLNQVHVSADVCCELTRICLRQVDDEDADEGDSDVAQNVDNALSSSTAKRLFELELYDMEPFEQLEVLGTLAYRVMNTYAVQIHMEDALQKASDAFQKAKQHKKDKKQQEKDKDPNKETSRPSSDKEEEKDQKSPAKKENSESIDLISRVKSRRKMAEQNRREEMEKKKQMEEERIRMQEEQRIIYEQERATRVLTESRVTAQVVRRRTCLGTDRNHNRYWLFSDGVPGLYIEHGWIGDVIDYTTMPNIEEEPMSPQKSPQKRPSVTVEDSPMKAVPNHSQQSSDDDVPLSLLSTPTKKKSRFRKSKQEATWPRPGQNIWISVDSVEELDNLINTLMSRGLREFKLRRALNNNYDAIVRSINKKRNLQQNEAPQRRSTLPSNGDELHMSVLRKHFTTMVGDATRGGISTLVEPDVVLQRVSIAESVSEFSDILLEVHSSIPQRFLKQYMTGISDKKKQSDPESGSDREKAKAERRVVRWRQAVEDANLFSRMSFLFTILNNSIKWELYHYKRTNARRAASKNRNYLDMNEGVVEEEEEEQDEEEEGDEKQEEDADQDESGAAESSEYSDEDEECGQRRSSRIQARLGRKKKKKKVVPEINRPRTRQKKRSYLFEEYESDEDEQQDEEVEEEEDASDVEMESDDSGDQDEEDADESEEEQEEGSDDEEEPNSSICRSIIEKIMKYQYSDFFRDPVDETEVPDYYDVISSPICLNDVLQKIDEGNDNDVIEQMMEDFRLLLNNAVDYNGAESIVVKEGERMKTGFVKACKEKITSPVHHRRLKRLFGS